MMFEMFGRCLGGILGFILQRVRFPQLCVYFKVGYIRTFGPRFMYSSENSLLDFYEALAEI